MQAYHKEEFEKIQNDHEPTAGIIKARKLGQVFLLETYHRKRLNKVDRQDLEHKGAMMYTSHIDKKATPEVEIKEGETKTIFKEPEAKQSSCC